MSTAWRDIATAAVLPWWTLAALRAAAEAFEQQAHGWHARGDVDHGQPTSSGRPPDPRSRPGHG